MDKPTIRCIVSTWPIHFRVHHWPELSHFRCIYNCWGSYTSYIPRPRIFETVQAFDIWLLFCPSTFSCHCTSSQYLRLDPNLQELCEKKKKAEQCFGMFRKTIFISPFLGKWPASLLQRHRFAPYSAKGPWNKSLNFIFPTKYVLLPRSQAQ